MWGWTGKHFGSVANVVFCLGLPACLFIEQLVAHGPYLVVGMRAYTADLNLEILPCRLGARCTVSIAEASFRSQLCPPQRHLGTLARSSPVMEHGALQDTLPAQESSWRMMWHIGEAVITTTVLLTMMLGYVLCKRAKAVQPNKQGSSRLSLRVWMMLLLPNSVMHVCGGALRET